jgi:hypothetical protein
MAARKPTKEEKALLRRYLVWCYKTTKESLDRIDRKFTQAAVDHFILGRLNKAKGPVHAQGEYQKLVEDFKVYVSDKEKEGNKQKFLNGEGSELHPHYLYLQNRLKAIEEAIAYYLGPQELAGINRLYEDEFTRRILESKEH